MQSVRFECPVCDEVQDPLIHEVDSNCRGPVRWVGSEPRCETCGVKIVYFRCRCGRHRRQECIDGSADQLRASRARERAKETARAEREEEARVQAERRTEAARRETPPEPGPPSAGARGRRSPVLLLGIAFFLLVLAALCAFIMFSESSPVLPFIYAL